VTCRAEFVIEPFVPGDPGAHVRAGIAAVEATGLRVTMGPFGSTVEGTTAEVARAMTALLERALAAGADRVLVTVSVDRA